MASTCAINRRNPRRQLQESQDDHGSLIISAASVTIVDGLKVAEPKEKCPFVSREWSFEGAVHLDEGAVHLDELNRLLNRSCQEYWEERMARERVECIQQAKEHWESKCWHSWEPSPSDSMLSTIDSC